MEGCFFRSTHHILFLLNHQINAIIDLINDMDYHFTTKCLHSDRLLSTEHGSIHQSIHPSVAYAYEKSTDLVDVFQGRSKGYVYGRQSNPTISALEKKVTTMEEGVATNCFSTGMAAISAMLFSLLNKGDHFISSQFLFGNTASLFSSFKRIGIDVSFVDVTRVEKVEEAIKSNTKMIFVETVANPVTQVTDLYRIGKLCQSKKLIYAVDNTVTSPYSFKPKEVGATFSINSLTKYVGGHANALGGSITDLGQYNWLNYPNILGIYKKFPKEKWAITQIRKKGIRDGGSTLSSEDAHKLSVGSDTLTLRYEKQSKNAQSIALYLAKHPKVKIVNYPGLSTHPQFSLAKNLFKTPGAILSFDLMEKEHCLEVLDKLNLIIISSHLGDNRTLAIPVAKTIFFEIGEQKRKEMNISESLIRLSAGIEEEKDLINDLRQALE